MNALINCFERLSNVSILVNDSHFVERLNRKQTTFILAIIIKSVIIARMIDREAQSEVITLMQEFPAVGLLGPRQVGKTT